MYRLLIVDDEPIIVDGLVQLFSEMGLELEIYSAYSVAEAMERVLQMKVDIVITDMRMPEKSGLQFIDELQLLWPQCRIIFLSGYHQFDYVYDAVKRHIDSYVLKTEDDEVLIAAVKKSIQKLEEAKSIQAELEASRQQMEEMRPFLKKEVLEALINGGDLQDLLQNFKMDKTVFEINIEEQWYMIAGQIELTKASKLQHGLLLNEKVKQELHPHLSVEFLLYDHHLATWLLQPKKVQGVFYEAGNVKWKVIKEYSKRFFENIQESYRRKMETKVNFVIGKRPVDATSASLDFQQMHEICKFMTYFSEDMIIVDQSKENIFSQHELNLHDSQFWKKKLLILENTLSEGDEQSALKMIDELFDQMVSKQYSNLEITDFLFSLSQLILEFLRNKDLYQEVMEKHENLFQQTMRQLPILIDSKEKMVLLIKSICQYQEKWRAEGKRKVIFAVNKYIEENIAGDLSLTALADFVHFNPSYLSRFYKEQTGINLSDAINEVRMKKAKYYLSETDIAIHEVASSLGFNSPSYFTLYFKKNMQQSPQAFREKKRKR